MRRLRQFFNTIMRLRRPPSYGPADIPKRLDEQTLAKVLQEARFLHSMHGVEVRSLARGEKPDIPRAVHQEPKTPH